MKAIIKMRKDSTSRDGEHPLSLVVHMANQKRVVIALGVSCDPKDFTAGRRLRRSAPTAEDKNLVLEKALARANEIFVRARLAGTDVTPESFKAEWSATGGSMCLVGFAEEELKRIRRVGLIGQKTAKHYQTAISKFRRFWPGGIPISRLTTGAIEEFDAWHSLELGRVARSVEGGASARSKALRCLRKFWRSAVRAGLFHGRDPWAEYRMPKTRQSITWLSKAEVLRLMAIYETGRFREGLRPFLFCCHTGLRLGDVKGLRPEHLLDGQIVKPMDKGRARSPKTVVVPISGHARKLLEDGGLPLVTKCDQYVNRIIKAAATECGIKKRITFHVSRHTFATMFMESGGSLDVLRELLGHSSIAHTLIYAHVAGERKAAQVAAMGRMFS